VIFRTGKALNICPAAPEDHLHGFHVFHKSFVHPDYFVVPQISRVGGRFGHRRPPMSFIL
jgi:hypothetical protein